jgi:hypothetical protein
MPVYEKPNPQTGFSAAAEVRALAKGDWFFIAVLANFLPFGPG